MNLERPHKISSPRRSAIIVLVAPVVAMLLFAPAAQAAGPCPNEAIREAQGVTYLPDCMALEMASPPQKHVEPAAEPTFSADGERVRFRSMAGLAETPGLQASFGDNYVATRGAEGWVTAPTSAPTAAEIWGGGEFNGGPYAYAADLTRWDLMGGRQVQINAAVFRIFQGGLDGSLSPLSPLLVPIDESGTESLVTKMASISSSSTSADLSTTTFFPSLFTTSYLPGDPSIGVDETGQDHNSYVVSADASGEPSIELLARDKDHKVWGGECGAHVGGGTGLTNSRFGQLNQGAVAADGSRIYFSTRPAQPASGACGAGVPTAVPLRILERIRTLAGPEITPLISGGPADWEEAGDDLYQGASVDGTKVYFTTTRSLAASDQDSGSSCSPEAGGASAGCDLYLYDSAMPPAERLIQVSAGGPGDPEPGKGATVLSSITTISGDGSHVYFVAEGVLTGENVEHKSPAAGQPNLYLYEHDAAHPDGDTAFIGTLDLGDRGELWGGEKSFTGGAYAVPLLGEDTEGREVGGDGHVLAFASKAPLTSEDHDGSRRDVYRYGAETEVLACISCSSRGEEEAFDVSAGSAASRAPSSALAVEGRWVSEDGDTIAFGTAEPLLGDDEDEAPNAYLWREGQLARFPGELGGLTVATSGEEVGFVTQARLLPQDRDTARDVYVARAGGGFPNLPPKPICVAEACQGARTSPPAAMGPAFVGSGNQKVPIKCKRSFVKKRGKCIKRVSQHKRKRAGHKRGGGK